MILLLEAYKYNLFLETVFWLILLAYMHIWSRRHEIQDVLEILGNKAEMRLSFVL